MSEKISSLCLWVSWLSSGNNQDVDVLFYGISLLKLKSEIAENFLYLQLFQLSNALNEQT